MRDTKKGKELIIPKHIQIESVNGICTSRCIMCTYKKWTRKPHIMKNDIYKNILEKFIPIRDNIQYLTLHGNGEPLLDKGLIEKIKIAKDMGFKGIGFATNCTELNESMSEDLIKAGLDTIICSVDGINKETHESIRIGTNFEEVVNNIKNFVKIRNKLGKTRVLVRFIMQEKNKKEWSIFFDYWSDVLEKSFGDDVIKFDLHNCAEKVDNYETMDPNKDVYFDNFICESLYDRIIIFSNGDLAFCDGDDNGFFKLGNVIDEDPIRIYNNNIFSHYRKLMTDGKIRELDHCKNCTIPRSRNLKGK